MTQIRAKLLAVTATMAVVGLLPEMVAAQDDCEALPAGRTRTDCFIGRARIQGLKSDIARDRARRKSSAAKLRATTGGTVRPSADPPKPNKR